MMFVTKIQQSCWWTLLLLLHSSLLTILPMQHLAHFPLTQWSTPLMILIPTLPSFQQHVYQLYLPFYATHFGFSKVALLYTKSWFPLELNTWLLYMPLYMRVRDREYSDLLLREFILHLISTFFFSLDWRRRWWLPCFWNGLCSWFGPYERQTTD
jgi:hypothetical protein